MTLFRVFWRFCEGAGIALSRSLDAVAVTAAVAVLFGWVVAAPFIWGR